MVKKTSSSKARRSPKTAVVPSKHKGHDSLLIELRTEELPPKSLERLSLVFASGAYDGLKEQGFLVVDDVQEHKCREGQGWPGAASVQQVFATPRRLAVLISQVLPKQPDRMVERKGPAVASAMGADGKPAPALLGFAKSCGVDVDKLEKRTGDKGEYFVYSFKQKGAGLAAHLATIVEASLKKLPVAKLMRWGDSEVQFVRPVHGLIMLHGKKVVPGVVLGLKSGNKTLGHRFLSQGQLAITAATDYEKILEKKGSVIADYQRRKDMIAQRLDAEAEKIGAATTWALGNHAKLLDEVASIVEYPVIYAGDFSKDFLSLPPECLIISMQQHQKYFPLADKQGKPLARFLFIANNRSKAPQQVIHGNERVLRARLSDAGFFYAQDQKIKLADRVSKLASVVYHNKLGSQLQRVERTKKLAGEIARLLKTDIAAAERAAYLAKADLLTDMVGEFPELQGTMGRYYARHDGETAAVADAIEQHYWPRYAGDRLPQSDVAAAVALADKLYVLAGFFGIGQQPTGDKDPFGLRRSALGVIRILLEKQLPLELNDLVTLAFDVFDNLIGNANTDVQMFIHERLKGYMRDTGYSAHEVEAGMMRTMQIADIPKVLKAIKAFQNLPEAVALVAANTRIINILKKVGVEQINTQDTLFSEPAERVLYDAMQQLRPDIESRTKAGDYTGALQALAVLKQPVDSFFDQVMVMDEDESVRNNRLALLGDLKAMMNRVADISKLAT